MAILSPFFVVERNIGSEKLISERILSLFAMNGSFASQEPLFSLKLVFSYKIFFTLELSFELYFYVINEILKGPGCMSRLCKCELNWSWEATLEL